MISNCRLCNSDDLVLWMRDGHDGDLTYYKCRNCKLWNYDLDCGLDQVQYTENYVSPEDSTHKINDHCLKSWEFLEKHADGPASIMDIGCGSGAILYLARAAGWQVRGMELTEKAAKDIAEDTGIDVIVANFLEYDNQDKELYDVVVLRHVLEHLPDSILAMNQIDALLKENGLALLEFPNTASVSYKLKRLLKNRGLRNKKYPPEWRPGHTNEFCRSAFEYLLQQTGFELLVWNTYSNKPLSNAIYRVLPIASKARALVRKKTSAELAA